MNIKNKKGENLKNKKLPCVAIIRSEEIKKNYDQFMVAFEARDLEKPSWSVYIQYLTVSIGCTYLSVMFLCLSMNGMFKGHQSRTRICNYIEKQEVMVDG